MSRRLFHNAAVTGPLQRAAGEVAEHAHLGAIGVADRIVRCDLLAELGDKSVSGYATVGPPGAPATRARSGSGMLADLSVPGFPVGRWSPAAGFGWRVLGYHRSRLHHVKVVLPWNGVDVGGTERGDTAQVGLPPTHLAADVGGNDVVRDASTTVLIAVEDSESESVSVVRVAHRLFGDDARYFVINVGRGPYSNMAFVSPVMSPTTWYPAVSAEQATEMVEAVTGSAEQQAAQAADAASLGDATALGEVGDPATAIIAAAHQHGVDVVVIGSHDRPWFAKLFTASVGDGVLRGADLPVLVVR